MFALCCSVMMQQLPTPTTRCSFPNGDVLVADIKNCTLLLIPPGAHTPSARIGEQDISCVHQPPLRFGSPNRRSQDADGDADAASETAASSSGLSTTSAVAAFARTCSGLVAPTRTLGTTG